MSNPTEEDGPEYWRFEGGGKRQFEAIEFIRSYGYWRYWSSGGGSRKREREIERESLRRVDLDDR